MDTLRVNILAGTRRYFEYFSGKPHERHAAWAAKGLVQTRHTHSVHLLVLRVQQPSGHLHRRSRHGRARRGPARPHRPHRGPHERHATWAAKGLVQDPRWRRSCRSTLKMKNAFL